jgi:mannan endo-1,6-alpha-mannosidase
MGFYNPATPGGGLPAPYYWWEAGGLLGGMLDYWHYTGDASFNAAVTQGLLSQIGAGNDFMTAQTDGNDDQGWWALAAMSAAEYGLPTPAGAPSWLALAQNVHNEFVSRWDTTRCNGGMKWKIQANADGYHYKSSIANGVFFQLSARLAKFTQDPKYADWASKSFAWMQSVGLIDKNYNVFDGTDDSKGTGCVDVDHDQWSYNVGIFLYGSAVMQAYTGNSTWADRTNGLLKATGTFFDGNVMFESKCEKAGTCNVDQLSFKAYLSRWLVATSIAVPSTQGAIAPLISASAAGAAASCSGGANQQLCGSRWYTNNFDGLSGVGQQLSALQIMHGLIVSPPSGIIGAKANKMARSFVA